MSSNNNTAPSFKQTCDDFLRDLGLRVHIGQRAAATLAMHTLHVRYLYDEIPPTTSIASIDEKVINSVAVRESQGRRRTAEGGSRATAPCTVGKRLCTLRLVLEHARTRGWRGPVPVFPRFPVRGRARREHLRDPGELEQLVAALTVDEADWIYTAVLTGQHPGDLHRMLAYDDADPFASPPVMRLRNTKNRRPEPIAVVMPDPLAERLRVVFERRQLRPGDPLLVPWDKDARSRKLRKVGRRLGLLLRRATDCRHTCASWAAHELGTITVGIKDWLQHSSMEMLQRVYAHALPPAMADVAAALTRASRRPAHRALPGAGRTRVSDLGRVPRKRKGP